jgi:TPR repeat protein
VKRGFSGCFTALAVMALAVHLPAADSPCSGTSVEKLKKSATEGSPAAQKDLADLLVEGRCAPRDYTEALRLYRLSAGQNHHSAQYTLGLLLSEGSDVPKNVVEGYMWIRLSAPPSDRHTRDVLEKLAKTMTRDQVKEAQRDAVAWMRSHLEHAQPPPK